MMDDFAELQRLIEHNAETEQAVREACIARARAQRAIIEWAGEQVRLALAAKGITPGKSVVRMKVRTTRKHRIVLEPMECLLEHIGRVDPPTMARGALGPHAASTDMWWVAHLHWQNIRKDGTPGATHDFCMIQGDTVADVVSRIEHVRDLE